MSETRGTPDVGTQGEAPCCVDPVRLLLRDRFPVTELIGQVTVPTVVVYGSADTVVPPEQSVAVAAAAGGPVQTVEVVGADHNDAALSEGDELVAAVLELARSLL